MSRNSRLNRRLEKQSKKNLFLSIFGIIFILFLLVKFGVPLIASFSFFLSGNKYAQSSNSNNPNFLSSPVFDPQPDATNSAKIKLTGKSPENSTVSLYLNGNVIDKTSVNKDGNFSFDETLVSGANTIFAKNNIGNVTSDTSSSFTINFKNTPPALNVDAPSDGQKFSQEQNTISVMGTTDPETKVTVNGFWAIVDQNNKFSYQLALQNGDNQIKIIATDSAGNTSEKDLRVNYSH